MNKWFTIMLIALWTVGCREKKKPLNGNDKVVASDFFDAFPKLTLPFIVTDSNLNTIKTDTGAIAPDILKQFIPDSALHKALAGNEHTVIKAVGKYEIKGKETYLVVKDSSKKVNRIHLFVFTKDKKFSASMPLTQTNLGNDTTYSAAIDNKLAISINKEWKTNNEYLYNRVIYAYNTAGAFTVVMTETNDQSNLAGKYINPIDTLSKKNKYSGDYMKGKKSIVSLRDGKTPNSYLFFVHFENDNEEEPCNGELKGDFVLNTPTSAIFSENNDPCVIDFTFKGSQVTVKEQGSCGSHRGIKCFFNDTFTKKKEQKATRKK